jgi:predicted transcriptional regulator
LALTSNRLANVQEFLQLPTAKTQLTKRIWRKAQAGSVPDLEYIIDHCEKDVLVLDQAYEKLKPYIRSHPRMNSVACAVCGGDQQRRGQALSVLKGIRYRYSCKECGHWETKK